MKYSLAVFFAFVLVIGLATAPGVSGTMQPQTVAISATTPPMPSGNYRSTCRNIRVEAHFSGNTVTHYLSGECLDDNGYRRESKVKFPCPNNGPVSNKNGLLVCT